MTTSEIPALTALTPVKVGARTLKNRLLVAPMTRVSAHRDGRPSSAMAEYYARFAAGGFAMVVTEGTYIDDRHSQSYLNQPGLVNDEHAASWREVIERVHEHGALVVLQLMHAGALSQGNSYGYDTVAPSVVAPRGAKMTEYGGHGPFAVPRAMTERDIDQVVADFRSTAMRARAVGFDGVEIHAANGYLLDQFLTTYTNLRADRYGGSVGNRARLTSEVTQAVRAATGDDFLVGVRLSQTKVNDFDYRWPGGVREAEEIFAAVAASRPHYLHLASEGRDWWETALLDDGLTVTGLARRCTGLPVVANGGMHDPAQLDGVLRGKHADLVSIGRAALADPDLPKRLAAGEEPHVFDRRLLEPVATLENQARSDVELHREPTPTNVH